MVGRPDGGPRNHPGQAGEKRRASRVRVCLSARYQSRSLFSEGLVTDLSPDGMFFTSDFLDSEGELARVFVQVPSLPQPLALDGVVCWASDVTRGGGMGIKLVGLPEASRQVLEGLVRGAPAAL